jgi:phage shock protein PspC (stress-responsive transcriptional regulator)
MNTSTDANPSPPDPGPTESESDPEQMRLHRVRSGRMLAGVAGGLADYLDVDPTLVRIAFVVLALMGGVAVLFYLAGWLLIPEEGSEVSMAEEMLGHQLSH